jgi:hypothetical protein
MTDICPEILIWAAAPKGESFSPSTINLLASSHVANLKRIICNVPEPVLLRLLVCKDEKDLEASDDCPYPEHKNREAVKLACNEASGKMAQIYIRHDKINRKARSCLIIFIEGYNLNKTDELLERLQNSVTWLGIAQERPYFYIFCYGYPMNQVAIGDLCKKIDKRLKDIFPDYSKEEDVCIATQVLRNSEVLFINTNRAKFSLSAS